MFRQISASAPSKVILHGEHAVVYGKSAVAASLDLRTRICLTPILNDSILEVDFPDVGVVKQHWKSKEVKECLLNKRPPEAAAEPILDEAFLKVVQSFVMTEKTDGGLQDQDDLQTASLTCFFYLYSILCDKFLPMHIKVESEACDGPCPA